MTTGTTTSSGSDTVLAGGLVASGVLCAAIVVSASGETRLGAPQYWPWALTALQVLALWAAGAGHRWGWLVGAAVQPPWIVYAVLTGQWGFIPGCAVSAAVQAVSYQRSRPLEVRPAGGRQAC